MPRTTNPASKRQPRRTQAERTQAMQQKLIDCAIDLLKEKRYASFRTAEVAERAGVSRGAQTHHFPSKDMLVLQALEMVYRDTLQRAMVRIEAGRRDPNQLLSLLVADSREFFLGDDFLLSLDLMMVDPSSSLGADVKRLAQQYRLPVEQAWLEAFVEAGHPVQQAKDVVRLSFAVARGFGIRQLVAESDEGFETLFQSWTRMAGAMLLLSSAPTSTESRANKQSIKPKNPSSDRSA